MIRRIDAGQNITVTLSLDPASPLAGLLDFHVTQANVAAAASGTLHVHATDGTTFGTCDIDYPVSLNP